MWSHGSVELRNTLARVVVVLLAAALSLGCSRGLVIRDIAAHDKIIRMYDRGDDPEVTIVISKWGGRYRKWRVTSQGRALLYQVDPTTRICWAGWQVVGCENVKRDPDLEQYVDW